ncbi:MAG: S24/S26 family peptidase [Oscillospiraceae bacterium]
MSHEFNLSDYENTIRDVVDSGGEFLMYPKGVSMLPFIKEGRDSVMLVKQKGDLKKNDIPFYKRDDGHYVLHRVMKAENGVYTICGDNQTYLEKGITNDQIIAVVSYVNRKGKKVDSSSLLYKIYLFFWQSIFLRRVCFKILRILGKR